MDKLKIRGGRALSGEVSISGAKNAALPILCAALLSAEPLELERVPKLQDVRTMLRLLRQMGVRDQIDGDRVMLDAGTVSSLEAPYDLVKTMRASVLVLGPLLARFGQARDRSPEAVRLVRARLISTSRAFRRWARRSPSSTAMWWRAVRGSGVLAS